MRAIETWPRLAPRMGMERVRRDRRPALGVDLLDGAERREARGHPRLEKEAEEMAVEGADLLADDDVDPEFQVVQREVARQQGPANLVMVGDGDDVEPPARGGDDRLRALAPSLHRECTRRSARPRGRIPIAPECAQGE
jgi:hypothetical protein